MISYLIIFILCTGILLIFYRIVLEKERMHHINRGYLIFSLFFSLTVPLIPVSFDGISLSEYINQPVEVAERTGSDLSHVDKSEPTRITQTGSGLPQSTIPLTHLIGAIYFIIATLLFIRLIRLIQIIRMKVQGSRYTIFEGYKVVLLEEQVVPHTFMRTIFVNRAQYQRGEIRREVLVHELTHAKQYHTLDILVIEVLKVMFWFNPLLYFYKKAIQLNHELLADQAVISRVASVSEYQKILLNSMMVQPAGSLSSRFNYSMTKKRLHIMYKNTPTYRYLIKLLSLLPLFTMLLLVFGCEPGGLEHTSSEEEITVELLDSEQIRLNGNEMSVSELDDFLAGYPEQTVFRFRLDIHPDATVGVVADFHDITSSYNRFVPVHNDFIRNVVLRVDHSKTVCIGGEEVTLEQLKKKLANLSSGGEVIVDFYTEPRVSAEVISDIQNVIRDVGVMRINYYIVSK